MPVSAIEYEGTKIPIYHKLQEKSVSPTKQAQTASPDSGFDGLSKVNISPIPDDYIIPSGNINLNSNGVTEDVTNFKTATVDIKNVQCYQGYATVTATSYTATAVSLTVAKTGTYKVSWTGWRNTNSGTSGSQLYIDNTAYGSANTSFLNTYGHSVTLTNVSLTAGQTITVRARARSTSYVMGVGNLTIVEN